MCGGRAGSERGGQTACIPGVEMASWTMKQLFYEHQTEMKQPAAVGFGRRGSVRDKRALLGTGRQ